MLIRISFAFILDLRKSHWFCKVWPHGIYSRCCWHSTTQPAGIIHEGKGSWTKVQDSLRGRSSRESSRDVCEVRPFGTATLWFRFVITLHLLKKVAHHEDKLASPCKDYWNFMNRKNPDISDFCYVKICKFKDYF